MRLKLTGLWHNPDFLKLWGARTTSVFGSQLASLAYPLTAILVLEATTVQVGILQAAGTGSAAMVGARSRNGNMPRSNASSVG